MLGPQDTHTGRAMLLFGAAMLVLGLWISIGRGDWPGAGLWYALAVFFGCYGALMAGAPDRWNRPLVILGLAAGVVAFGFALRAAGLWS